MVDKSFIRMFPSLEKRALPNRNSVRLLQRIFSWIREHKEINQSGRDWFRRSNLRLKED